LDTGFGVHDSSQGSEMTPKSLISWRERLYGARVKSSAARALGLSQNAYDAYEAGKHRIPLYIALACAAIAHGVPPIR
jgi:hypothetical protein